MKFRASIYGKIGACLTIENCPSSLAEEIVELFTFDNPAYLQAKRFSPSGFVSNKIPPYLILASRKGNDVLFPRGIDPQKLSDSSLKIWNRVKWLDLRTRARIKFPKLLIGLNREQRIVTRQFKKLLANGDIPFGNFLFVKPTSTGKTVSQAEIARLTGQRTLIICVTNLIRNAWRDDLKLAFGIAPKDLGLIQQKVWKIGKWFTLASIATIREREHLWTELFEEFGTVILDEAHTVTAPSLFTFLMSHPAKFLIGATATDKKEHGKNFYLSSTFGKVRKRITSQQKETDTSLPLKDVRIVTTAFQYEYQQQNLDLHDLHEHLISDEKRNRLIVNKAYDDWCEGHSVLVTTYRLAHVYLLEEMLRKKGVVDLNVLTGETNTKRKYSENLRQAILDRNCRCLVATVKAIKLGGNLNPLDRLHLAMPPLNKTDLEQLIGRIRRKWKDKKDVVVTYYLDSAVLYLFNIWKHKAMSVWRKLRVPKYKDTFII